MAFQSCRDACLTAAGDDYQIVPAAPRPRPSAPTADEAKWLARPVLIPAPGSRDIDAAAAKAGGFPGTAATAAWAKLQVRWRWQRHKLAVMYKHACCCPRRARAVQHVPFAAFMTFCVTARFPCILSRLDFLTAPAICPQAQQLAGLSGDRLGRTTALDAFLRRQEAALGGGAINGAEALAEALVPG